MRATVGYADGAPADLARTGVDAKNASTPVKASLHDATDACPAPDEAPA